MMVSRGMCQAVLSSPHYARQKRAAELQMLADEEAEREIDFEREQQRQREELSAQWWEENGPDYDSSDGS